MEETEGRKYTPISLLAEYSEYDQDHLGLLCRQGKLQAIKIDNKWLATRESLERYSEEVARAKKLKALKMAETTIKKRHPGPSVPSLTAPSALTQTVVPSRPGRADLKSLLKNGLRFALLGLFVFTVFSSIAAFAKNDDLKNNLKKLGGAISSLGEEFADTIIPPVRLAYDDRQFIFQIGNPNFLKFGNLRDELDLSLYDFNLLSRNLTASIFSPLLDPITFVWDRLFGERETKTADLEQEIKELKDKLSEQEVRIQGSEKNLEQRIETIVEKETVREVVREVGTKETVIERIVSSPDLETRLLSLEEYVNQRFSQTPTILVTSGGGGNQGVTILNPATTDSETVKVSSLLDVSGSAEIDGKTTIGGNLVVDTNTFFVDSSSNRVGIGTTSLETALEVVGTASVSDSLNVGKTITIGGTLTAQALFNATGSSSFAQRVTITKTPTSVHTGTWPNFTNTEDSMLFLKPSSAPPADANFIIIQDADGNPKFDIDAEGDIFANNLILTGSTTQGTTNVTADLTVEGNTTLGDAITDNIYLRGTVVSKTISSIPLVINASASQTADLFRITNPADQSLLTVDQAKGFLISSSGFNFAAQGAASVSYSRLGNRTTSEAHYISNIDDLLISGDLEVDGSVSFAGPASISSTLYVSTLGQTGNVGIGTTSPGQKLQVAGGNILLDNAMSIVFKNSGGTTIGVLTKEAGNNVVLNSGQDGGTNIDASTGENIVFLDGGVENMRIIGSGNVGIGSTSPSGKLDIVGDLTGSTNALFRVASASELFRVQENGNVGIGTTSPTSLLTIQGRGEFQGTASASYLLTGNTLQVGGFASVAYSRFGTNTTGHSNYMSSSNDVLVSEDLEVRGTASFGGIASVSGNFFTYGTNTFSGTGSSSFAGSLLVSKGFNAQAIVGTGLTINGQSTLTNASVSGNFELTGSSALFGINAGNVINTMLEVGGTASISGATTLRGVTYTWPSADGSASQFLQTNGSGTLAWATAGVASNSLDFDEFVTNMNVDVATTINLGANNLLFDVDGAGDLLIQDDGVSRFAFTNDSLGRFGLGDTTPETFFEIASSSGIVASISNTFFVDGGNQRVGIGTTGPGDNLHIFTNTTQTTPQTFIEQDGAGDAAIELGIVGDSYIIGIDNSDLDKFKISYSATQGSGVLGTNDRLTIDSGGNVGIGTTSPGAKLDVVGRVYAKGSDLEYNFIGWDGTDEANASYLYAGPRATGWNLIGSNATGTGVLRKLGFTIGGEDSAADVKMTINTNGNVGIGTTSPDALLELSSTATNFIIRSTGSTSSASIDFQPAGGASSSNQGKFTIRAGGLASTLGERLEFLNGNMTSLMTIASSGNVGIGTTGPESTLHIKTGTDQNIKFSAFVNGGNGTALTASNDIAANKNNFEIIANNIILTPTANVGIGTTGPTYVLHVLSASTNNIAVFDSNFGDGNVLRVEDTNGSCDHNPGSASEAVSCTSDARLKTNIQEAAPLLDYLTEIPIRNFQVIADGPNGPTYYGTIAQELLTLPDYAGLVSSGSDDYYKVAEVSSWKILKGVQELDAKISSLSEQFHITDSRDMTSFSQIRDMTASQSRDIQTLFGSVASLQQEGNLGAGTAIFDLSILFNSIVSKFSEMMGIFFENGLVRVAKLIANTVESKDGVITYDQNTGEAYCIKVVSGEVKAVKGDCSGTTAPQIESAPEPTPELTPEPSQTSEPTPSPTLESSPEPIPEATPAPTEPAPEATPEQTPETEPISE